MNTITWNNGAVEITDEHGVKWHSQPDWPDTTPWASEEEARAWAQTLLDWLSDQQLDEPTGVEPPKDGPS